MTNRGRTPVQIASAGVQLMGGQKLLIGAPDFPAITPDKPPAILEQGNSVFFGVEEQHWPRNVAFVWVLDGKMKHHHMKVM